MNGVLREKEDQSFLGKPLISVLFPVYNGADYLEESLQSVLDQAYDNFEIIIIDFLITRKYTRVQAQPTTAKT